MRKIICVCAAMLLCAWGGNIYGQNLPLYDQAMQLNAFRTHYADFCAAIGAPAGTLLVPGPDADTSQVDARLLPHLINILKQENSGFAEKNQAPPPASRDDIFSDPSEGSPPSKPDTTSDGGLEQALEMRDLIREWYFAEAFVLNANKQVDTSNTLNLANKTLTTQFPSEFQYLAPMTARVQGVALTGYSTSSVLSGVLGGIPQAEIIQGIVDFAIQRAKEELLQAFLQGWLDDLQRSTILKTAFPNTLNLLATSDLTTILSQGDVWKAAFKQDLDAIPQNLPAITTEILDKAPGHISPEIKREIIGLVTVASQLYLRLDRNHNNLTDAVSLTARELMLLPDTLAYSERALIAADVLIGAVQTVKKDVPAVVKPINILELTESQLCDLWNVIYLNNKAELQRALEISQPDSLYKEVLPDLGKVQLILAKTADILQNIDEVMRVKGSGSAGASGKEVTFQNVNAYYALVLELINNSLELTQLVDLPTKDIQRTLDNVVAPLGKDILGIVEGVSTQQYGLVVTNSIDLLRVMSAQVVKNPQVQKTLEASAEILQTVDRFAGLAKTFKGTGDSLKAEADSLLTQFLREQDDLILADFRGLLTEVRDSIRAFEETELEDVKDFLKQELKQLKKDIRTAINKLESEEGLDPVAEAFNTYGRLMVNILTAENSSDVQAALNDAAAPTGSYMVKQTSKSTITLSLFPGVQGGYEYARAPASVVAIGGDTLTAADQGYLGATLPVCLEFTKGIRSRILGAIGINLQVADLGAVLNYRLANPGDSVSISPEIGFSQVLAPGASVVLHAAKVPLVFGGGVTYSPQLRNITDGNAQYNLNMLQVGGFIGVDVTVFQLFASRRKIRSRNGTYED